DDLPGAVEPHDGGHAALHGARDRPVLPRPARVRRGRDADGGEGMSFSDVSPSRSPAPPGGERRAARGVRLAVVGAGSTYTPELVSGLDRLKVERLAFHDVEAERLEVVGGMARR